MPVQAGSAGAELEVIDLGRMRYAQAYEEQLRRRDVLLAARQRGQADAPMFLLLVEHDPVITVSRRPGAGGHLLAPPGELARLGIEVCETDRGGDITYHGPGQLVVYPILDLQRLGLGVAAYLRWLEGVVIATLAHFDVQGHRDACATGVWVGGAGEGELCTAGGGGAKICALGIRVGRWITMHGLALNVSTNLEHFRTIVPCGLMGRSVTSLQQLLGPAAPPMDEVKGAMAAEFRAALKARAAPAR
ncbi:MAG: lipoyl(octanoyl) transferase LipB [Phycisphaerales bacterium]|nr:lipoyl(octanoyl) transferase LipB [Phycisphaerales bacterium]